MLSLACDQYANQQIAWAFRFLSCSTGPESVDVVQVSERDTYIQSDWQSEWINVPGTKDDNHRS
jgi:hypothetical protein